MRLASLLLVFSLLALGSAARASSVAPRELQQIHARLAKTVYVRGFTRRDGRRVEGYWRSAPSAAASSRCGVHSGHVWQGAASTTSRH